MDGMKLQPYPDYKDSGLLWLGKVPKHWNLRRAKYLMRELNRRSKDGSGTLLSVSQYTGVTKRRSREGSEEPDTRSSSLVGYKIAKAGDLVSNIMLAWNGSLGIAPIEGVVSPAHCVYRICKGEPWFFHHLLHSPIYKGEIKRRSRGVVDSRLRLYTDDLFRIPLLLPNSEEQRAIVRFVLDFDHQVRRFIRNRRRLIEVLNEQKQAIINRAVARGLASNALLKISGIDWLGDIPVHWDVRKLGNLGSFSKGRGISRADITDSGVPAITYGDIYTTYGIEAKKLEKYTSAAIATNSREILKGDLLFTASGETIEDIGKTTLYSDDKPGYAGGDIIILRLTEGDGLYLSYVLNSSLGVQQKSLFGRGDIIVHIAASKLKQIIVPFPSKEEQISIARFLDDFSNRVHAAISRARHEINLICEYRIRLISDVVTGKMDIRHFAPPPGGEDLEEMVEALEPQDDATGELDDEALAGQVDV